MRRKLLIALVILLAAIFVLCIAFAAAMRFHQGLLPETEPGRETTESVTTGTMGSSGQHTVEGSTEKRPEKNEATAASEETAPPPTETVSPSTTTEPSETTTPEHEETQPTVAATEEPQDADELPIVPNI